MAAPDIVLKRLKQRKVKPFELQKALGVSPSMASRILDGSRGVSSWHLDAVAALLGMTLSELFDEAISDETVSGQGQQFPQGKSARVYKIAQHGSPSVRQNMPPVPAEGSVDAHAHDRPSQPQAALNAQVRDHIDAIADRLALASDLEAVLSAAAINIATIRKVRDALRSGSQTPGPRATISGETGSRTRVRRNITRRRRA